MKRIHCYPVVRGVLLLVAASVGSTFMSCGDFGGPRTGTESGNPINPPAPPAESEFEPSEPEATEDPVDQPMFPPVNAPPTAMSTVGPVVGAPDMPTDSGDPTTPPEVEPSGSVAAPATTPTTTAPPTNTGEAPMPTTSQPAATGGVAGTAPMPTMSQPSTAPQPPSTGDQSMGSGEAGVPCEPEACLGQATASASHLAGARPLPAEYDTAICDDAQCTCSAAGAELVLSSDSPQCVASGRFGECLYEAAEYTGCSADGDECESACGVVYERQRDEAARSPNVSVLASGCGSDGTCNFALESEFGCVLGPSWIPTDCSRAAETVNDSD